MMEVAPDYLLLCNIFPHTDKQVILDVIAMVEEESSHSTYEENFERMVDLLSGDEAQGPISTIDSNRRSLLAELIVIYPHASQVFLLNYLKEKPNDFNIHDAIDDFSLNGYERVELDPGIICEQLRMALPNADPLYLKEESKKLALLSQQEIDNFVQKAIDETDYPTMQDYIKNKKHNDELALYKHKFNVDKFLEIIPNPFEMFSNPDRVLVLDDESNDDDIQYALTFLYNKYPLVRKKHIDLLFQWKEKDLVVICDQLDHLGRNMIIPRGEEGAPDIQNVPLLQLVTYLKNRKLIKSTLKYKDERYKLAKEEAKKFNLLESCQCCFDEELIPEECYFCMKGCVFCKDCLKLGVENSIGRGDLKFLCFNNCESSFSFQTLQMVLPEKLMTRLTQKVTSEAIKQANVEGLETCPFCDFAVVLPEDEKLFKCLNEECLIESCRLCRHKSHVPLKCSEIEYDEDVRSRTYIENKMTEALTRTCYSCKMPFIKTNGCNKMTCNCGAKMCYLCGVAVVDYSHFGDGRCALYTNDKAINLDRILQNVQLAKNELGNVEIKFDPSANIQNYYT